jgi:hypothetical protein
MFLEKSLNFKVDFIIFLSFFFQFKLFRPDCKKSNIEISRTDFSSEVIKDLGAKCNWRMVDILILMPHLYSNWRVYFEL